MTKRIGLSKYPKRIPKSEIDNNELFFVCPRAISSSKYSFTSLDIATAITILSYTSIVYDNIVKTPMLSLDLIGELVLRSKSKKNKDRLREGLNNLHNSGLFKIKVTNDNIFTAEIDVSSGYFKFYHNDLYKIMSLDTVSSVQKALHVATIEFSMLYGNRGSHDSPEKFVTYRSHVSLGEMCGLSRQSVSRVLKTLEDEKIIAVYNVKMTKNGAPIKSLRASYRNRDFLRKYTEEGMGITYARVIDNKEKITNGQETI